MKIMRSAGALLAGLACAGALFGRPNPPTAADFDARTRQFTEAETRKNEEIEAQLGEDRFYRARVGPAVEIRPAQWSARVVGEMPNVAA